MSLISIGSYEVLGLLGEGGMGAVYRARDPRFDREVAIKVLHAQYQRDPGVIERFKSEAVIQAKLSHPHIVTVLDFIADAESLAIVMEYVEGKPLSQAIQESGPMAPARAAHLMAQILGAMGYAHSKGLVHRDIKPSNIMIQEVGGQEFAKVMDFGIAKILGSEKLKTATGAKMGTLAYMSPEHVKSPKHVDARSDIYSLGVVLYEMLTGRVPFDADSEYDLMKQIVERAPDVGMLEGPLRAVVERATEKEATLRYRSCQEMTEQLFRASSAPTPTAHTLATPGQEERQVPTTGSWRWVVGAVVVLAFALFGAVLYDDAKTKARDEARREQQRQDEARNEELRRIKAEEVTRQESERRLQEDERRRVLAVLADQGSRSGLPSTSWVVCLDCTGAAMGSPQCEPAGKQLWLESLSPVPPNRLVETTAGGGDGDELIVAGLAGGFPATPIVGPFAAREEAEAWVRTQESGVYQFAIKQIRYALPVDPVSETVGRVWDEVQSDDYGNHTGSFVLGGASYDWGQGFAWEPPRKGQTILLTYVQANAALGRSGGRRVLTVGPPVAVTDISVWNAGKGGARIGDASEEFEAHSLRFLQWNVSLTNFAQGLSNLSLVLWTKYFTPSGGISRNPSVSPPEFTQRQEFSVSATEEFASVSSGWGSESGGSYTPGPHRIEFYVSARGSEKLWLIGQSAFTVR